MVHKVQKRDGAFDVQAHRLWLHYVCVGLIGGKYFCLV